MSKYELYIPSHQVEKRGEVLLVEGGSWMEALKAGIETKPDQAQLKNIRCDIIPGGMLIRNPSTGSIYHMHELREAPAASPRPAIPDKPRSDPKEKAKARATAPRRSMEELSADELFEEMMDRAEEISGSSSPQSASKVALGLALEAVPAESGAVFIADMDRNELWFGAAAGPKAAEVMKYRIRIGQGLAGFSVAAAVTLCVSDVHKDPRFCAEISQKAGYETHSLLCAPCEREGRVFAAIELINRRGGTTFTEDEVNVVNYLAYELATFFAEAEAEALAKG